MVEKWDRDTQKDFIGIVRGYFGEREAREEMVRDLAAPGNAG